MKKTTVVIVAEVIILCILIICFIFGKVPDNKESVKTSEANLNISDMKGTIPRVALTFDDGPSTKYTEKLLKGLKKRGVKATFFLTGERISYSEKIVKRMKKDGHVIGNHTYTHIDLAKTGYNEAKKEIEDTNNAIKEITGEKHRIC